MKNPIRLALPCIIALLISLMAISDAHAGITVYDKDGVALKFSGRIQPTFEWREKDNQTMEDSHQSYDFFVRRARLQTEVTYTNLPFPVYGKMEWKLDNYLQEDSAGMQKDAKVKLENAFVRFDPYQGMFRIEFGLENSVFSRQGEESDSKSLFIDRSMIVDKLAGEALADNNTGLHLKGSLVDKHLRYGVGIYEGSSDSSGTDNEDIESDKLQYAFGLVYDILDVESDMQGSHVGDGKNYLTVGAYYEWQNDRNKKDAPLGGPWDDTAYGFDIFSQLGDQTIPGALTGAAGYFILKREFDSTGMEDEDRDGWYVQMAYLLPGMVGPGELEFAARYQEYTPDNDADHKQTTLGANYYIKKHNVKVMADYNFNNDSEKTTVNNGLIKYDPGNTAALRVQLMF